MKKLLLLLALSFLSVQSFAGLCPEEEESTRVKDLYKVEMEMFTLGKNDELKLLGKESLGLISK